MADISLSPMAIPQCYAFWVMRNVVASHILLLASSLGLGLHLAPAPNSPTPVLLVVNQGDHNLSFIDPGSARQVLALDVGGITGHEVAVSPDGRTAFVPIYGNSGVGRPGTDGRTMAIIDVRAHKVVKTFDFGHGVRPHCAIYDAKHGLLYVTTELDQAVTIIDPHTLKIVGKIPTGQQESHMLAVSHDGRFGYTANVGPGTVSVLDMRAHKTLKIIPISANTQRISISKDDRQVFTADQTKPRLAVIDTSSNNVATWIPLPAVAYGTAPTADGRWLLATMRPLGEIAVIDLSSMKVVRTIHVPGVPTEILMRPDGRMAYVSCGAKVAAIDLSTWTVAAAMDAGKGADGLAWSD